MLFRISTARIFTR